MQRMEDAWNHFMATGSVTAYLDYKYAGLDRTTMRIGTNRDNQEHPDLSEKGYKPARLQGESGSVYRQS